MIVSYVFVVVVCLCGRFLSLCGNFVSLCLFLCLFVVILHLFVVVSHLFVVVFESLCGCFVSIVSNLQFFAIILHLLAVSYLVSQLASLCSHFTDFATRKLRSDSGAVCQLASLDLFAVSPFRVYPWLQPGYVL